MKSHNSRPLRPVVMVIGGQDPSGGAGIQADIEAVLAAGCHAVTVLTAVTVQDTQTVQDFMVLNSELVLAQMIAVMKDFEVAAVKTGMMGSSETVETVCRYLQSIKALPIIVDPVLASNAGDSLSTGNLATSYRQHLLPIATIITPNTDELNQLARNADSYESAAQELLGLGCEYVLVTGGHVPGTTIENILYGRNDVFIRKSWPRLAHEYHGSGCTLASALAAQLALGKSMEEAVAIAQGFTCTALVNAEPLGHGQWIPNRKV